MLTTCGMYLLADSSSPSRGKIGEGIHKWSTSHRFKLALGALAVVVRSVNSWTALPHKQVVVTSLEIFPMKLGACWSAYLHAFFSTDPPRLAVTCEYVPPETGPRPASSKLWWWRLDPSLFQRVLFQILTFVLLRISCSIIFFIPSTGNCVLVYRAEHALLYYSTTELGPIYLGDYM